MADTFTADIYQANLGISIGSGTPIDSSAQNAGGGTMRDMEIEVPGGKVAVGSTITFGGQDLEVIGTGRAETYDQFLNESMGDAVDVVIAVDANGNQVMIFPDGAPDGVLNNPPASYPLRIRDTEALGYNFEDGEPICFAEGTLIRTPLGDVAIETLRAGDLVLDSTGAEYVIRWIGSTRLRLGGTNAKFRPVRITAGSLGVGKPNADLRVSPQHRVHLSDGQVKLLFALDAAMAPAKHLVSGAIDYDFDAEEVTYHHILCDEHVVLIANNLESESLLLGDMARSTFDVQAWSEVRALFPELDDPERARALSNPAAPVLKAHEAALWREDATV